MGDSRFIGVLDSGVGGIHVLAALADALPHERFVFFGDSANTPYGEKPLEWVVSRTREVTEGFLAEGAKAIVIACNTATSAAAGILRAEHPDIPIVGIEPALKPAALACAGKRILVMATPMTLRLEKFQHLADEWSSGCTVVPIACDGLAARIEKGNLDAPDLRELLEELIGEYRGNVDAVVLGCTHYPSAAAAIRATVGDVPLFDGAEGTARHLVHLLEQGNLLNDAESEGSIELRTSSPNPAELDLYRWFLDSARASKGAIS